MAVAQIATLLATILPLLKKAPGAIKGLTKSKNFIPGLLGGAFLGQTALDQMGKAGDRNLSREELALQKILGINQADVTKRMTEESRKRTKEYTEALLKARKEDKKERRESELMQSYMGSQDRQTAMLMQAVQGVAQAGPKAPRASSGMVGLMRGT
jgi:hypothetical protein